MCQSFVLERDLESLPCMIKVLTVPFLWMKERNCFCFWPPRSLLSESKGGGHGRWSRQMMTFKPCGISDMWLGYVNTCNYLIQQVLSLQLRTGCGSSWIWFRLVTPESCLIYVWQITTSLYAFFSVGYIFLLRTALDVMVSLFFTIFNTSHHKCSDLVLTALWNLMILFISS